MPKRTALKAVRVRPASPGNPTAALVARGGEVSLKYFGAGEAGSGVVATVKGRRVTVTGGFTRFGLPGQRTVSVKLGGHVFVNTEGRKWRGRIQKAKLGVFIPLEMTSGATLAAFERVTERGLPAEAAKVLAALLPNG